MHPKKDVLLRFYQAIDCIERKLYQPGQSLCRCGNELVYFYVVEQGVVTIELVNEDIVTEGPGFAFGIGIPSSRVHIGINGGPF